MAISQPSSTLHLVPQRIGLMIQLKFLAHMLLNSEIKADMVSSFQKIKSNLLKRKCMLLSQSWETKLWQDVAIPNKSSLVHLNNRVGVHNKYFNMIKVVFEAKMGCLYRG